MSVVLVVNDVVRAPDQVSASARAVLRNVRVSVAATTAVDLRALVVLDRRDKTAAAQRVWEARARSRTAVDVLARLRVALDVHRIEPVVANSTFGRLVLWRALRLGPDAEGVFDASRLFRNTWAYVYGLARAATLARFALHVDSDWRIEDAGPPAFARGWLDRATAWLKASHRLSALCLDYKPMLNVRPNDHVSLRARYGVPTCNDACTQCTQTRPPMRSIGAAARVETFDVAAPEPLGRSGACGYVRTGWLPGAAMLSNQAYMMHLPRFTAAAWPFSDPSRFSELMFGEHTIGGNLTAVHVAGRDLGVVKCVPKGVPGAEPLRPEAVCKLDADRLR